VRRIHFAPVRQDKGFGNLVDQYDQRPWCSGDMVQRNMGA
jgi:hypothetical protein